MIYETMSGFSRIIHTIDNCGSWQMVKEELQQYQDELSKEDMIIIFNYYWTIIDDFRRHNK